MDDNFISRVPYTKELLRALAPLHASGELGEWSAETTLNVAKDEELLDLFPKAGCSTLIIGFESISEATLLTMDKKVNFCLTYQEAMRRIHSRGLSVVGNFIVGFDTDTLSVFKDILDFVDEHMILYPFFSILTPMPGTALHEEYKEAGRLDHLDWGRYDTRHVVFEPKHMSREQLMDGYCWLYEEAYAGDRALDRLERYWHTYRRSGSSLFEKSYIEWRLLRFRGRGTPRFQRLMREGRKRLWRNRARGDVGQLLYYFDSAHFCDYLDRFRSPAYEANVRRFRQGDLPDADPSLVAKQWEHQKRSLVAPTA